jgi:hypothetical protein
MRRLCVPIHTQQVAAKRSEAVLSDMFEVAGARETVVAPAPIQAAERHWYCVSILNLERVVRYTAGGVAGGRPKFKTAIREGLEVASRRGRSPGLLPTLLPSTPR